MRTLHVLATIQRDTRMPLRITFEGAVTITDADGTEHRECVRHHWTFDDESSFLVQIAFGNEAEPRVQLAGNERTPARVIGETIASAIRATSQSGSHREPSTTG